MRAASATAVALLVLGASAACTDPNAETGRRNPRASDDSGLFAPAPREPDFPRDAAAVVQTIDSIADSSPSGVAVGSRAVWVTETEADDVIRIDTDTGAITARIPIPVDRTHSGRIERAPTVTSGGVWLCIERNDVLVRIDPAANRIAQSFRVACRGLSAGPLGFWVGVAPNAIARYDDATGAVRKRVVVPDDAVLLAQGFGSLWAYNGEQHVLHRVDPVSGKLLASVRFGSGGSLVVGERAVYVADGQADTITVVDPKTNRVTKVLEVPGNDRLDPVLAVGDGAVWLSTIGGGLARLDERRLAITSRVQLNRQNRSGEPAVGFGFIWYPTYGNDGVLKVRPLR
ncbi:MAG: hypothetical protein ABR520_03960 [Mycobacteriales bacterium]